MHDFKNLNEVIDYVQEALVIDLMDHVMAIDEDPFIRSLIDPPEGIYLMGAIEPLLEKGKDYFLRSLYQKPLFPGTIGHFTDFAELRSVKDDIVNVDGDIIIKFKDIVTKPNFFKQEPTVPVIALRAAISVIEQYITSASRFSKRSHPRYRLEYLVKSNCQQLVIDDEYNNAFKNLINTVSRFISDDEWCVYYTKVRGTSLVIEKGIDYRIFKYYEDLFTSQESTED